MAIRNKSPKIGEPSNLKPVTKRHYAPGSNRYYAKKLQRRDALNEADIKKLKREFSQADRQIIIAGEFKDRKLNPMKAAYVRVRFADTGTERSRPIAGSVAPLLVSNLALKIGRGLVGDELKCRITALIEAQGVKGQPMEISYGLNAMAREERTAARDRTKARVVTVKKIIANREK